jgi:transposase
MGRDRFDHRVDRRVDHKGDDLQRVEVITGVGRRRNWPPDFKARVVAESLEGGAVISDVARRHGLRPQQLFTWRNQMRSVPPTGRTKVACFASVIVAPVVPERDRLAATPAHDSGSDDRDLIEVVVDGTIIRVRAAATAEVLVAILRALKATS